MRPGEDVPGLRLGVGAGTGAVGVHPDGKGHAGSGASGASAGGNSTAGADWSEGVAQGTAAGTFVVPGPAEHASFAALEALKLALTGYLTELDSVWRAQGSGPAAVVAAAGLRRTAGAVEAGRFTELAGGLVSHGRPAEDDPLVRLVGVAHLDTGETLAVAAAWWAETDPQFAVALGCAHDDAGRRYASAGLLRLLLAPYAVRVPAAWEDADRPVRAGVLQPGAGCDGPLRLTATARRIMAGRAEPDVCPAAPPPARHGDAVLRVAELLTCPGPARDAGLRESGWHHDAAGAGALLLRGQADSGVDALAYAAVRAAGRVPVAEPRPRAELSLLARTGAGVPVLPAAVAADLHWGPHDGPLIAVGGPNDTVPGVPAVDVADADVTQRAAHWRVRLRDVGFSDRQARTHGRELAARLAFGERAIDAVADSVRVQRHWAPGPVRPGDVWPAVRRSTGHALHRLATPITPAFTLADLVVPDDVRAQLDELVAHVRLAAQVLDGWGFRRKMPRGQGVAALFSGPPGTGKTMAAEAVAAELEQDLYRVDLSVVVSKYIGETEKNLAAAFEEAERGAAVLLFDECEGLFGKRTEQRDAHDRWANLGVDFLLQRVESFTGLVVLATNKRAALDEAFLRRLRFSVRFDLPDAEARAELWRRCLPERVPRAADLDFDDLARRDLAGGSVANAALAAAFLAARDGGHVDAAHLATALRREYDKLGKAWTEGT